MFAQRFAWSKKTKTAQNVFCIKKGGEGIVGSAPVQLHH